MKPSFDWVARARGSAPRIKRTRGFRAARGRAPGFVG